MIEQIKYINHLNEVIEFGKNGTFINYNTLRDYSWDITSANNKIASFKKGIVSKTIPVIIKCHSEEEGIEIRNRLFEVFEKDVLAKKNGRIIVGDYYLKCFITGSKKTKYLLDKGYMELSLTMKSDYPAWIKESYSIYRPKSALNTSETAEGREILIGNATNSILTGYGVYGRSEQKSYTGKNLLQNKATPNTSVTTYGITFTVNSDISITANGTSTGYSDLYFLYNENPMTLPKGTYTFSGCPSGGDDSTYYSLLLYKNDDGKFIRLAVDYGKGVTFTIDKNEQVSSLVRVVNGATVNNLVFKPMVRLASITDDTYEQYVGGEASPNPSYPQDIVSVADDGNLVVKSNGKNLLKNIATSQTINGVTFTVNSDKSITANGTATTNTILVISEFMPDLPDGDLIFSGCPSGGSLSTYYMQYSNYVNYAYTDMGEGVHINKFDYRKYTTTICLIKIFSGVTVNNIIFKPMIRLASIDDATYEPHQATTATIPINSLRGIKVSSGGNFADETGQQWVCDTLEKYADGSGKLVQRIVECTIKDYGVVRISADANWYDNEKSYSYELQTPIKNLSNSMHILGMSSHFTSYTFAQFYSKNIETGCMNNQSYIVVNISKALGICESVESFKQYCIDNNVKFLKALAEPIETPLTAEQIAEIENLQTFEGVTYITNEDDAFQEAIYSIKQYLDFPYGYEYDFTADFDSDELLNTSFVPVDFRMVIHGAITNPSVFISGHEYSVNVMIDEGDYLTIDSQAKTIVLSKQDGTQVNCFNNRNRDSYIFEKIPSGKNGITSAGDLNIDITLLDERSEPRWT